MGPTLWTQPIADREYLGERKYVLGDWYYVVRILKVASVLNMCRLSFVIIPYPTQDNYCLHSIYTVLDISNLEIKLYERMCLGHMRYDTLLPKGLQQIWILAFWDRRVLQQGPHGYLVTLTLDFRCNRPLMTDV